MKKHIAVIGGGLAGTAAAHALVTRGYDVTIIEKNDYLGGRIRTHLVEGAAVEMGACFTTNFYTNLLAFIQKNNLGSRLYSQRSPYGIVRDGQLRMANYKTLAGNSALSWRAKLQLLPLIINSLARWRSLDHHAFWKAARYDNRSVSDTLSGRREELLEYFLQPGLNGYLYWTPEHTSEAIVDSMFKAALLWRHTYRLQGGLQRIPEKAAKGSAVLLDHTAQEIKPDPNGRYRITVVHAAKTKVIHVDGIVCATTASVVPKIFTTLNAQQQSFFQSIAYSSTAVLARTYTEGQTRSSKGIAFPRSEGIDLAAVTLAPERGGHGNIALLRTYASGAIGKQLCEESDDAIIRALTKAMEPIQEAVLIDDPAPSTMHVQRWPEALPHFDVGHLRRLYRFENGEIESRDRAIVFAGDYLEGPFMEGAFTSGVRAADRLQRRLVNC